MTAIADLIALANEYGAEWSIKKHHFDFETGEGLTWDGMDIRLWKPQGFQIGSLSSWRRGEAVTSMAIEEALGEAVWAIRKQIESRAQSDAENPPTNRDPVPLKVKEPQPTPEHQRRSSLTQEQARVTLQAIYDALDDYEDPILQVHPVTFRGFYMLDMEEDGTYFKENPPHSDGRRGAGYLHNRNHETIVLEIVRDKNLDVPWRLVERSG